MAMPASFPGATTKVADKVAHYRLAVSTAASLLSLVGVGGIPTYHGRLPSIVELSVEKAATTDVYYTLDKGRSTPSATLGFPLPVGPQKLLIAVENGLVGDEIKMASSSGTTYVQCRFEWLV